MPISLVGLVLEVYVIRHEKLGMSFGYSCHLVCKRRLSGKEKRKGEQGTAYFFQLLGHETRLYESVESP